MVHQQAVDVLIYQDKNLIILLHYILLKMERKEEVQCGTVATIGVRGVYFMKGKWMAKIVFQKKQYNLGLYETLEEAALARQEAEKLLFDGAVTHYEKWRKRAEEDSEWAKENPIEIIVSKKYKSELEIIFLPSL